MRNFSIMIHERIEREIPVNIRKTLADSEETLPSQKKTTMVWWATTKQTCRDELVVYLCFSSHNIYIALLLCIEHCFTKVKILQFIYIYIYIYIGSLCIDFSVLQCSIRRSRARYRLRYREKNRETILLSLQACFVSAHSSGDFIVKNIRTIV